MSKEANIQQIKDILGLDHATIRQIGIGPLMTQLAILRGMENVGRCDADSGHTGQYFGDLEKDLPPK